MKDEKYITENMKKEFDRSAPDDFEALMERAENYIPDEETVPVVYEKRRTGKIIAGVVSSVAVTAFSFILFWQNSSDIPSREQHVSESLYYNNNRMTAVSEFSDKEMHEISETGDKCVVTDISRNLSSEILNSETENTDVFAAAETTSITNPETTKPTPTNPETTKPTSTNPETSKPTSTNPATTKSTSTTNPPTTKPTSITNPITTKPKSTINPTITKPISTTNSPVTKPTSTNPTTTKTTSTANQTTTPKHTSSPHKTTTIPSVTSPKQTTEITEKYIETLPTSSSETETVPPSGTLYQFPHVGGDKTLTRAELIELSKKGDELDWSDFEEYGAIDTGSGNFILEYMIDGVDDYRLMISGNGFEDKPQTIILMHDLCSEEGRFGDGKSVDVRKTDMEKFFDCGKMPFYLKKDDIATVSITSYQYSKTVELTDEKDIKDVVRLVNKLIIYEEDNSYQMYDGNACLFTIVMNDGSEIEIMTYSPFVIINGTGYIEDHYTCDALDSFGLSKLS